MGLKGSKIDWKIIKGPKQGENDFDRRIVFKQMYDDPFTVVLTTSRPLLSLSDTAGTGTTRIKLVVPGKKDSSFAKSTTSICFNSYDGTTPTVISMNISKLKTSTNSYKVNTAENGSTTISVRDEVGHCNLTLTESCFPLNARVRTKGSTAPVHMGSIRVGQLIQTADEHYEPVICFSHRDIHLESVMCTITFDDQTVLTLSHTHLTVVVQPTPIYNLNDPSTFSYVPAVDVEAGMCMMDDTMCSKVVNRVTYNTGATGIVSPCTSSGTIVVDGTVVSCFTTRLGPGWARICIKIAAMLPVYMRTTLVHAMVSIADAISPCMQRFTRSTVNTRHGTM